MRCWFKLTLFRLHGMNTSKRFYNSSRRVFVVKNCIQNPLRSSIVVPHRTISKNRRGHVEDQQDDHKFKRGGRRNFDILGSWNYRMDMDIDMEMSIKSGKLIPKIDLKEIGIASLQGRRKVNEDRTVIKELAPNLQMFAIYDGHGGSAAADFVSKYMEHHLVNKLEKGETNLQNALQQSFDEVNYAFTRFIKNNSAGDNSLMHCGTTATVCLLRNGHELIVAHVGDSKALICRQSKVVRLTQDHKPDDVKEAARIKSCGGHIVQTSVGRSRVNGSLDMTRSIGDVELKQFGVTAEPTVRSIEVKHGKDAFLVLATDGVTYVVTDQEVVDFIAKCKTTTEGAYFITDQALLYGSEDNCTAVVVPLGAWGKFANTSRTVNFTFGRNIIGSRYG